jgi:hypothetical protein
MKTDSILEELYQVRADMVKRAGNDFDTLFAQLRERHQHYEAEHPEVKWVDFSGQAMRGSFQPKVVDASSASI